MMNGSRLKVGVYYLFAFWLLAEWLIPLKTVSDTQNANVFIVFVGLCFLFMFLRIRASLVALINVSYIAYTLNALFFDVSFFSFRWLPLLVEDVINHVAIVRQARWFEVTNVFRSLLFFVLLWMMTYVVRYWLFVRKRLFVFYVATVAYVAILDTFTAFRGNGAIVRLVALGFLLLHWLVDERIGGAKQWKRWLAASIGMISVCLVVGYVGPKLPPQWPDPVPFIKSYAKGSEQGTGKETVDGTVKKVGYGTNDSRLGGPFVADDTVVFTVEDEQRHYWRVETKSVYTGKGWETADNDVTDIFEQENHIYYWFEDGVEKETFTAIIRPTQPMYYLAYPLGLKAVHALEVNEFLLQMANEKIYPVDRQLNTLPLFEHEIVYEHPIFSVEQLNDAPAVQNDTLLAQYTQLPATLPSRVRQLAEKITNGKQTQYEKVKAVEQYFRLNGFDYETTDVAVPGDNDDYVDQFLFETKKGYCDNFSTSMVVLLRSVGIPARWVKGYTAGQLTGKTADGKNIYTITNKNAHSWVEVYFSGVGWVPFEPTQGFANPYRFTQPQLPQEQQVVQPSQSLRSRIPVNDLLRGEQTTSSSWKDKDHAIWNAFTWKKAIWLIFVGVGVVFLLYKIRRKWWPYVTLFMFRWKNGDDAFVRAYVALLKHLQDYGLKRKQGETLRQYAAYVDRYFGTTDMSKLTYMYEKAIYKQQANVEWEKLKELWENLIKKTVP
jgi:transglutaminase-like putative cysteine protease